MASKDGRKGSQLEPSFHLYLISICKLPEPHINMNIATNIAVSVQVAAKTGG